MSDGVTVKSTAIWLQHLFFFIKKHREVTSFAFTGGKEEEFNIENGEWKGREEVKMQHLKNKRETWLGISEHRGQEKC